ncbi:MAG: hypothetical protein ABS976_18765 [Rhodococcus sp. (in: high G+C Gram-positive bacteria)]
MRFRIRRAIVHPQAESGARMNNWRAAVTAESFIPVITNKTPATNWSRAFVKRTSDSCRSVLVQLRIVVRDSLVANEAADESSADQEDTDQAGDDLVDVVGDVGQCGEVGGGGLLVDRTGEFRSAGT